MFGHSYTSYTAGRMIKNNYVAPFMCARHKYYRELYILSIINTLVQLSNMDFGTIMTSKNQQQV